MTQRDALTEAQQREAIDIGNHAIDRAVRAITDAAALCSDPRQRMSVALQVLCGVFGAAAAEIDRLEGRPHEHGRFSVEAYDVLIATLAEHAPRGASGCG